jgi:STE24 endopeptidase
MARDARPESSSLLAQLRRKLLDSQAYNLHKSSFSLASMGYSLLTGGLMLCCGFTAWAWDESRVAAGQLGLGGSEVAVGSVFLVATSLVGLAINLPLSLYKVFWLEAKFGFNQTTPGTFAADLLKGFLVEMALTLPLMAAKAP